MTSSDKPRLLIVDDDEDIRRQMKWALREDYEVDLVEDRLSALDLMKQGPYPVVSLDLGLPPDPKSVGEGFQALADILQQSPSTKVIIVTGQDEKGNAIKAVGLGAYDFFCKPIQVDEFKIVLRRAFRLYQLEQEHRDLQSRVANESFEGMLGNSPKMREVFATIAKVAPTDVPVLILGESGTGKELVARCIHARGARKDCPIVTINCAAIPENLLESELFGHEKGAFTGAHLQRKGRIELARDGTLFLDEIGDIPLSLQVKILRFLQEHTFDRIGGRTQVTVDTRIISATNRNLQQAMRENLFREDLYYRIGVVVITLPPLREREEDVLLLSEAFLRRFADKYGKKTTGFSKQAVQALLSYNWPGNVRELENRIKRAVVMAQGPRLTEQDLEIGVNTVPFDGVGLKEAREKLEKELILRALAKTKHNLTKAAAELGISRPSLYELMGKLSIGRKEANH